MLATMSLGRFDRIDEDGRPRYHPESQVTSDLRLDRRRPQKLLLFCNGNQHFKGKAVIVNPRQYRDFGDFLGDMTHRLPPSLPLAHGVRQVFTPVTGRRLNQLSELEDGHSYVCAGFETFKRVPYGDQTNYKTPVADQSTGRKRTKSLQENLSLDSSQSFSVGTDSLVRHSNQPPYPDRANAARQRPYRLGDRTGASAPDTFAKSRPRIITIFRNSLKPFQNIKILFNRNSVQSYEQFLRDVAEAFDSMLPGNRIQRLMNVNGRKVQSISDLFRDDYVFIGIGREEIDIDTVHEILGEIHPNGNDVEELRNQWEREAANEKRRPLALKNDSVTKAMPNLWQDKHDISASHALRTTRPGGPKAPRKFMERRAEAIEKMNNFTVLPSIRTEAKENSNMELRESPCSSETEGPLLAKRRAEEPSQFKSSQLSMTERQNSDVLLTERMKSNNVNQTRNYNKQRSTLSNAYTANDSKLTQESECDEKIMAKDVIQIRKDHMASEMMDEYHKRPRGSTASQTIIKFPEPSHISYDTASEDLALIKDSGAVKELRRNRRSKSHIKPQEGWHHTNAEQRESGNSIPANGVSESGFESQRQWSDTADETGRSSSEREVTGKLFGMTSDGEEAVRKRRNSRNHVQGHRRLIHRADVEDMYELGKILGDGNFAVVQFCKEVSSGKEFAMKIVDKAKLRGKQNLIENEILIMKACNHPNIVKLHHEYETISEMFLVMELVGGGDLFEFITSNAPFMEVESAGMIYDLAKALAYLHCRDVVHRDVKPENIVLQYGDGNLSLKLADFGLATEVRGPLYTVCGTPTYVAPEILSEIGYGLAIDMWAIGVILYILMCGFAPFRGEDPDQHDLFEAIKSGNFEFTSPYWDNTSDDVRDLITHLLQVDVRKRYTAVDVICHPFIITCAGSFSPPNVDQLRKNIRDELTRDAIANKDSFSAVLAQLR